ncbi:hypothetical protein [Rossellomorea marisflavi]|uniref:hypothetical protein n=1 Tax=Rossellomorea marisflavi TaxID=189381 RepID=UPI003FA110FD
MNNQTDDYLWYDDFLLAMTELEKQLYLYHDSQPKTDLKDKAVEELNKKPPFPKSIRAHEEWEEAFTRIKHHIILFSPVRNEYHFVVLAMLLGDWRDEVSTWSGGVEE